MSLTVFRKSHFNAAHRLYRSDWDDDKNKKVFGKCSNPNFHGHNYELEVGVTGEIDQETGFLIDIVELKTITLVKIYSCAFFSTCQSFNKCDELLPPLSLQAP